MSEVESKEVQDALAYEPKRKYFVRMSPEVFKLMFRYGATISYDVQQGLPGDCLITSMLLSPGAIIEIVFISRELDEYVDVVPDVVTKIEEPLIVTPESDRIAMQREHLIGLYEWNIRLAKTSDARLKKQSRMKELSTDLKRLCKKCRASVRAAVKKEEEKSNEGS